MQTPRIPTRPSAIPAWSPLPCAHLGDRPPRLGLALALLAASCSEGAQAPAAAGSALAEAPTSTALALPTERAGAELVARARWGSGDGELGRSRESHRSGPAAIAAGPAGELLVLDQVNRRVVRLSPDGRWLTAIPIESEAALDLVAVGERVWVLLYEPGPDHGYRLSEHRRDGTRLRGVRLPRDLDLVTGLFAVGEDLYVEERHEEQLLVVRGGVPVGAARSRRARLLGRPDPSRPGSRLLLGRDGRRAIVHQVFPGRFTSPLLEIELPLPVVAFEELLVDARGGLYLGLFLAAAGPDGDYSEPRRVLVAAARGSAPRAIAIATERAAETSRPLAVAPDGTIHELELAEEGATIRRWRAERGGAR